jgi:hypothetical protein
VAKMGNQRYVNLTSTDFRLGQQVSLKPKGMDLKVLRKVVSQGNRKLVIIPKNYWDYFRHGSEVYIRRWKKKGQIG